jgi:small subunit ribosomal protein S1
MRVKVIGLENLGTSGERVSLSAKALATDPWATVRETFKPGEAVRARVVRLVDYGAFVELVPGIEGLVHVSEFGGGRVGHPKEVVEVGQEVEVKVLRLDFDRRRISLSMRDAPLRPQLKVGALVEGTVASVKPYGVFIRIHKPQEGLDGMIPSADAEVPEGTSLSDAFPAGRAVQAKVVRVDARGRIRLSIRALHEGNHAERHEAPAGAQSRFGIMADAFKRARGR